MQKDAAATAAAATGATPEEIEGLLRKVVPELLREVLPEVRFHCLLRLGCVAWLGFLCLLSSLSVELAQSFVAINATRASHTIHDPTDCSDRKRATSSRR